jgi:hypothetical protein
VQRELDRLRTTLRQIEAYNESMQSEIAVTRRAASAAEEAAQRLEKEKQQQDYRIDGMQVCCMCVCVYGGGGALHVPACTHPCASHVQVLTAVLLRAPLLASPAHACRPAGAAAVAAAAAGPVHHAADGAAARDARGTRDAGAGGERHGGCAL